MLSPRAGLRVAAAVTGVLAFSLLSCGREVTAPQHTVRLAGRGMFSVEPRFPRLMNNASISAGVAFEKVRVVLRRPDGSIALDTMIAFPPGADSVSLAADVALATGTGNSGENFKLSLGYVNAAGDTVFKGGPVDLTVLPKGSTAAPPPPIVIPVVYSGTGATATSVRISPRSLGGYPGDPFLFSAEALDATGRVIAGTPIFWASGDASKATLNSNLGGGGVIVGGRGSVKIFAQLLTGQVDSVTVTVQPRSSRLELVSGDGQSAATSRQLASPLVVRVMATDGQPVSGVAVTFAPSGGAVTPATATSDASGLASSRWTLPATPGHVTLVASAAVVSGAAGQVTFNAHAVAPLATRLVFENSPPTTAAGATLGALRVSAKDSSGTVVTETSGSVSITLSGGVDTARLGGTRSAPLVEGVATFSDLTVNRVGAGYVLTATAGTLASGASAPFAITEGPATQLRFVTEGGSGVAGRALGAMRVTAFDAQGNLATLFRGDITMRINVNPGGGRLGGTATRAANNGSATFDDLTIDRAGAGYTLAATATGLANGGTTPFDIVAGAAGQFRLLRGGGQSAPPGTTLDTITVSLTDSLGNPVVGAGVGFTVTTGAGTVVAISSKTNSNGVASAKWTLGGLAGSQVLTVVGGGLSLSVVANAVGATTYGPGRMFLGFDTLYVSSGAGTAVTVFLSAAQAVPVTVSLSTLDTLSQWATSSVVIPAGATAVSATIAPKLGASGYSHAIANATGLNADTLTLVIQAASIRLLSSYVYMSANGDTLETQVALSAPAPAGGVTVTFDLSAPGVVHLAPSAGTRPAQPYDPCSERASEERAVAAEKANLAKVLSPTTVYIKPGELSAYLYIIGDSTGYVTVTPIASGYGSQGTTVNVYTRSLWLGLSHPTQRVGPGLRITQYVYRQDAVNQQSQPVTLTMRTPGVAAVPTAVVIRSGQNYQYFNIDGLAAGSTWLVAQAAGFSPDSVQLVAAAPKLFSSSASFSGVYIGSVVTPQVGIGDSSYSYAGSAGSRYASALAVTATSRDTSIVRPVTASLDIPLDQYYVNYPLRVVGSGNAWVVFSAPGHLPDSTYVNGIANSQLQYNSSYQILGLGQYAEIPISRLDGLDRTVSVTSVSSDPAVLSVDSIVQMRATLGNSDYIRMVGRSLGTATVTFSAPGYTSVSQAIAVSTGHFGNTVPVGLTANGASAPFQILARDSADYYAHPVAADLSVSIKSLDTTIVKVDTSRTIPAGSYFVYTYAYPRAAGTTSLVISAAGYKPDTFPVTVSSGPATSVLTITGSSVVTLGKGQWYTAAVTRNVTGAAATVTVTKSGSSTTVTPASFSMGAGASSYVPLDVKAGSTPGQDVIIVSSPGYVSDTVTVKVGTPRLQVYGPSGTVLSNYPYSYLSVYLSDSLGNTRYTGDTVRINVASSDTTVGVTNPRVLTFLPGDYYQQVQVTYRGPGTMRLRLHDVAARYPDDSTAITTVVQPQLYFQYEARYNPIYVGMRQATAPGEAYVSTDYDVLTNTVVKFARSTSALVTMPDSVIIPAGSNTAYFGITGADTVGSLRLTASSPGFASATANVEVTRPAFWINQTYAYTLDYTSSVEVTAVETGRYYARTVTENVPVSLAFEEPALGYRDTSSVFISAGGQSAYPTFNLSGTSGRTQLRAYDARAGFRRYAEGRNDFVVTQSSVRASPNPLLLGIGQSQDYYVELSNTTDHATIVTFANSGAHTGRAGASADTVPAYDYYRYGTWTGLSYGADTVTVSSVGTGSSKWAVLVDSGSFDMSTNRTVKLGDSLSVTLYLRGPDGSFALAAAPTTIAVATSNGSWNGSGTDSGSQCAATGPSCSLAFSTGGYVATGRIKPTAAGVARVTVTGPGYRARSFDIQVLP